MKPTEEDFEPRRDGWFEHKGVWGEVTVGTVLADPQGLRTKAYEVIATAHPAGGQQVEYGKTLWFRVREMTSGDEATLPPRFKNAAVKILTRHPADTSTPDGTPASDSGVIALLVEKLGATHLATRDAATGEITCPDYASGRSHGNGKPILEELEHLRFAHGLDTSGLEAQPWDDQIREVAKAHGRLHANKELSTGGFPHRHVPEDLSIL